MRNRFALAAALFALLTALLTAPLTAAAAADRWRIVTTEHFKVLSQLDDRDTKSWIRSYDEFIAATSGALGIKAQALPPLTVVLFSRDRDYIPYKLKRPDGRTANVAGQFSRQPSWSVIGLSAEGDNEVTRQIIYHEGVHWLMSVDPTRQPAWFSEGIAEMMATFEQRGNKMNWARPSGAYLGLLNSRPIMPLREFLAEPSAIFNRDDHTDRYYAQSWAFVHFLTLSKDSSRRQLLTRFLQAFRTSSGEAAIQQVFGDDLPTIEKDFKAYLGQRTFGYISLPATAGAEPPDPVAATPDAVESALGLLALGADHRDLARTHAERAIQLAPTRPGGHEILAYLALRGEDSNAVAKHAEAALSAGSRDADMYMLMAQSYAIGNNSDRPDADATRVRLYEQAINLSPRRLDTYHRLVEAMFAHEKPRLEDRRFLEAGLKVFPGEDWIKVGIATANSRLGDRDGALRGLDEALRPDSTLDETQRNFAATLRSDMYVKAMNSEIQNALDARNFRAAREILARYRNKVDDDAEVVRFLDESDRQFEVQDLLERMRAAQKAGRTAEMRQLIDQVLANPALTAEQRGYVESLRRSKR